MMADKHPDRERINRRNALAVLAGLVAVAGGWQIVTNLPRGFAFEPIERAPGWRRLVFDGVSGPGGGAASAIFAGLDPDDRATPLPVEGLCEALFSARGPGTPVAAFTDYFCPYCRTLNGRLAERTDLALTWHQLPLLGPASDLAARAALAADAQGGFAAFHATLTRSPFRPSTIFLADLARRAGLDADVLLSDMEGEAVATRLARSRSAAATLGIWGTPATVVGRTLVMGAISDTELDRLIDIEREGGGC